MTINGSGAGSGGRLGGNGFHGGGLGDGFGDGGGYFPIVGTSAAYDAGNGYGCGTRDGGAMVGPGPEQDAAELNTGANQ